MFEPASAFQKWTVAGLILNAVRHVVPDQTLAVHRLLIDAHHAIARLLKKPNGLAPTRRIVPILTLKRALHGDADIRLGDGTTVVSKHDAWRLLRRVNAKDIAGRTVQANVAEVTGHAILMV